MSLVARVRARLRRLLVTRSHLFLPRIPGARFANLRYLARYSRWINSTEFPEFAGKFQLYRYLIDAKKLSGPIDYLEFGAARGETIELWAGHNSHRDSRFFGFDTFEGLPEDWERKPKGSFSTEGKSPAIDDPRCHFEIGLFEDRLEGFLTRVTLRRPLVIHLDADLYSSTSYVLNRLGPLLERGDLLIFDQIGAPRAMTSEFRAWEEYARDSRTRARIVAGAKHFRVLALEIEQASRTV